MTKEYGTVHKLSRLEISGRSTTFVCENEAVQSFLPGTKSLFPSLKFHIGHRKKKLVFNINKPVLGLWVNQTLKC